MNFTKLSKLPAYFKKGSLALFLIILIGSVLRLQGVFSKNFAFTYDVGRDMLALYNIIHLHKIPLIGATTGIQGVFYGPWWYYMLVPFFVVFSGNPQGIAFIMSIVGILCIFLAYYLGKKIGNTFLGISMALITGVSPSLISASSQIWNPNVAPLLVFIVLIILERIYSLKKRTKLKYFLLLGILLALNIDIEILWGILFSIGILLALVAILRKEFTIRQIILTTLGMLFIFLPRLIFDIRHGFLMTKSFLVFLSAKTTEDKLDLYHFVENRINIHLDNFSRSFIPNQNYLTLLLLVFIIVSAVFFYKKSTPMIKNFIVTQFTVLLVFYIGTLVFGHAVWPHYLIGLPVIYISLLSVCLLIFSRATKPLVAGFVLLIIFLANGQTLQAVLQQKPFYSGNASVYGNQLEVIDYIYKEAKEKKFKYVVYTPPVYDYTYQYLFLWYGPQKYHYSPSKEANLAYFIIEPDPGYEDRPIQWLKFREGDGKIIKSTRLHSGIEIQTRVH